MKQIIDLRRKGESYVKIEEIIQEESKIQSENFEYESSGMTR